MSELMSRIATSCQGESAMSCSSEEGRWPEFDPRNALYGRWETDEDPEDLKDDPISYDEAFGPPNPRRRR